MAFLRKCGIAKSKNRDDSKNYNKIKAIRKYCE